MTTMTPAERQRNYRIRQREANPEAWKKQQALESRRKAERHRERVNAYNRAWRAANKDKVATSMRNWMESHPKEHAAHARVHRAVDDGILIRATTCAHCDKECKTEASHDDYSKPLDVEWLCRRCHAAKDRKYK